MAADATGVSRGPGLGPETGATMGAMLEGVDTGRRRGATLLAGDTTVLLPAATAERLRGAATTRAVAGAEGTTRLADRDNWVDCGCG